MMQTTASAFFIAASAVGYSTLAGTASARADETIVICKEALAVPAAAAACAAVGVVVHELFLADRPFGPNGELMKIILMPVSIMDGNIKAIGRESGELAKVLRGISGISIRDIERYGILGGPGSVFHKPFG
ncbi:hypothetical protein [Mesorhizobium sp. M0203]